MSSCENCRESLVLFIDNEIEDSATFNDIAFHLQECEGCRSQMETERRALNLIRTLLTRSCCETAPSTLQERIAHQSRNTAGLKSLLMVKPKLRSRLLAKYEGTFPSN
jgi:mycothiol system anti-sigma-R factor